MKHIYVLIFLAAFSCSTPGEKEILKTWLGQPVNFNRIREVVHTYHMFDTTGAKVGSMIFGWAFENGKLISIDTSQFDDGSVYETVKMEFDTAAFQMTAVSIDMQMGPTVLDIDLAHEDEVISGLATMRRDTILREFPIDSAYGQHAFREELYMLMHTLDYNEKDSLNLNVFVPTSLGNARATIMYVGQEQVEVPAGKFDCTVILLQSNDMPTNRIWISNQEPRKMVKFYVPGHELNIELVATR